MRKVLVTVRSRQRLAGELDETMELTTEGTLHREEDCLVLFYEETRLSGLEGTLTTFRITPDRVVLERTGAVSSRMEFVQDTYHKSLYRVGEGALLLSIYTRTVENHLEDGGGTLRVAYDIEIEETAAGSIEYDIVVAPIN